VKRRWSALRRSAAPEPSQVEPSQVVAGVDLGSNSFHLLVARVEEDGRVHVLDRLREPVRLAAGLDESRELTAKSLRRAVSALERFGERLRGMSDKAVRAVGTNTLRIARNAASAEELFSEALGHPVETISGREEARLIYLGVAHSSPGLEGRLLVLDIGGGSTECIIGKGLEPLLLDSLYMGCVGFTQRFFGDGRVSHEAFRHAELAASLELSSIREAYRDMGWDQAIGSSGTILAVREVLRSNGWSPGPITPAALERLEQALVQRRRIADLALPGLEAERASVFPGGVAILKAALVQLGIASLETSQGALREGLVHELLGRVAHGDPRDRTVDTLAARYKVDLGQAARVERTALALFDDANESWQHDPEPARRFLAWAIRVHEIGLSIAYSGYHKHGAYILEHAEMPGFSLDDQAMLSTLVGAHRRKISRRHFEVLHGARVRLARDLTLILRVAARLHHSRSEEPLPPIRLRAQKSRLRLGFPAGWLDARPLTRADLEEEAGYLEKLGVELDF
jgi:exopolyphosphatase/guanosine-5'-triphosphate,3'-diphosphate pyrophosphatase